MNFEEIDKRMRPYEQSLDQRILPEIYMAARIDGRSFSRLTREICHFDAPYDVRFKEMMVKTVEALMDCGFRVVYGYTQSDEISLLFHPDETAFGRKTRKYNSILAGQASAVFSVQLGQPAVFDCRMIPLPTKERVQDYFMWRQEDAHRNAMNGHAYWLLRSEGMDADQATQYLKGKSVSDKNELLFSRGINFDKLPSWQKRGIGVYWSVTEKQGLNPLTGEKTVTQRRILKCDEEIPFGMEYAEFIGGFLTDNVY